MPCGQSRYGDDLVPEVNLVIASRSPIGKVSGTKSIKKVGLRRFVQELSRG